MERAEEFKHGEKPIFSDYNDNFAELISMGFNEEYIKKSLQLTNDRERAVELILKFEEEASFKTPTKDPSNNPFKAITGGIGGASIGNLGGNIMAMMDYQQPQHQECKMVFIARQDLGMGTGKIATQVGHAVLGAYKNINKMKDPIQLEMLRLWEMNSQPKIVLKIKTKEEMLEIERKARERGINTFLVCDLGKTQVEAGTMTVCALGPYLSSDIDKITGHLKLL